VLKTTTAVMVAATIAAAFTVLSAPSAPVDASPLAKAADEPLRCLERPWPYLHCVGTKSGSRHIRLVNAEHIVP
jgi:hypothetical protein